MQTATIEQNRQRGYERYEQWRRFEEATDIAERIGYPIDHIVHYEMRGGMAYGEFDKQNRPFRALTDQARREGHAKFTGVNQFEAIRREHEHQEALLVDKFGRGELAGTILVKISPVPDAVRSGTADINGYRRDLLRSFVRMYYRTDRGIDCRLFSLDQSDPIAMAAVGDLLGIDVDGRSSEDVLADHALVDIDNVSHKTIGELVAQTTSVYDRALEMQTGEYFRAGSRAGSKEDALSMVIKNGSLLDEHMKGISDIMSRVLDEKTEKKLLDERRKRTAAAMDVVAQGVQISSSDDAAVTEQMATKDYEGDCATEVGMSAVGMSQGAQKEREWKKGQCVACLKDKVVGECSVCRDCENDDNNGADLLKRRAAALKALAAKQRSEQQQAYSSQPVSKEKLIQAKYGRYASIKTTPNFGGADRVVYDRRNNEVIDVNPKGL